VAFRAKHLDINFTICASEYQRDNMIELGAQLANDRTAALLAAIVGLARDAVPPHVAESACRRCGLATRKRFGSCGHCLRRVDVGLDDAERKLR